MSVSRVDALAAITIGSTTLTQVKSKDIDPGIRLQLESMGGSVQPSFAGLLQQELAFAFTTTEIARMLGICGVNTVDIPGTATSVASYYAKLLNTKTYAGALSHDRDRILCGMILPTRITARQGQPAEMEVTVVPVYDGTNNPVIQDVNQTLPTGVVSEMFTLGPGSINGVAVNGGLNVSVMFNWNLDKEFGDGDTWMSWCASLGNSPHLELSTPNRVLFNQLGISGGALSQPAIFYLRSIQRNKVAYANASAQHIKMTMNDGCAYPGRWSGQVGRRGEQPCTIVGTYDGTNAALAIATAQAIV